MVRATNTALLVLLVSNVKAFVGPDVTLRSASPCLTSFPKSPHVCSVKTRRCTSIAGGVSGSSHSSRSGSNSRSIRSSRRGSDAREYRQGEGKLEQQRVLSSRRESDDGCDVSRTAARANSASGMLVSAGRRAFGTVSLAAFLTFSSFFGEVPFPSPTVGSGAGAGIWFTAPAFAELEPLPLKSYSEEFSSGLAPVNTVRGLWRTRETRNDGSALPQDGGRLGKKGICGGRLYFKGFVGAGKGTVEYKGCGDREGKGRWLTKPKNIVNGRITLSARWSIKFSDGTSLLYRGDVVQDAEAGGAALRVDTSGAATKGGPAFERPDAHIRGEVLRPVTSVQGTLTEKKIGEFEADLIELPSDRDTL